MRPQIDRGFPEDQREAVAALYWAAFGGKLGKLLGPGPRALRFLAPGFDPAHAISVAGPDAKVLGVAGFKTAEGAFADGGWRDLVRVFGVGGATWRAPLLALLSRKPEPDILLMDGIAVSPEARGQGLGSLLLDGILEEARRRGLSSVRLDVVDTNPRARALYERKGFQAVSEEKTWPFGWLFGFASATRMERRV